jgi:hypothetical protein
MPTSIASGTLTADGTEQDLATDTSNKTYVLKVDTAAMVNGETIELRVYTKCLTGGAERLAYLATYGPVAPVEPMKYSHKIPEDVSIRCTLKQTAYVSAYKDFPWKLLDVGPPAAADILAEALEGSLPLAEALRITLSALAGKSSGGGTSTVKFRDHADSKDRITATVDSSGNRTEVVLDGS